jgi:aryl-alcohol dehydrogenase-like predicted oxidoreductase
MAFSGSYGPTEDIHSVSVIEAALEQGVTLLDTADFYGMGHNEMLIREALWNGSNREKAFISLKAGVQWGPDRSPLAIDVRPASMKNYLAYSLRRLGTDYVDLYQPARVDSRIPIEDTIGAISDLVSQGYVRYVGLSEASAETVRRAHETHPISALQIEYSVLTRGVEDEILPTLRELGISLVAYGVLSRGLIGGRAVASGASPADARTHLPRFQGDNLGRNLRITDALGAIARERGLSVSQLAIAWVLSRGEDIVPLVGARNHGQLADAIEAVNAELTAADLASVDEVAPEGIVAGTRYAPSQMAWLDSERRRVAR